MLVDENKATIIKDDDVYWEMHTGTNLLDKQSKELMFEDSKALARLLAEDVIFLNNHWYEKTWPKCTRDLTSLNVICNDVFYWACSDAEEILFSEIQSLYDLWLNNHKWGPVKWCAMKRNLKPQPCVVDAMKADDVWSDVLESLDSAYVD